MKLVFVSILAAIGLLGCDKQAVETHLKPNDTKVEKMFEHEGCTTYRFFDAGNRYFYTVCGQDKMVTNSFNRSCGKGCVESKKSTTVWRKPLV